MKILKKIFFAIVSIYTINNVSAQGLKKGDMAVDFYCGWPNWDKVILRSTGWALDLFGSGNSNSTYSGFGPFGGRYEYMIMSDLGLSVDFGFVGASNVEHYLKPSEQQTHTFIERMSKLSAVISLNYHFLDLPENMDFAFNFGMGPALRNYKTSSTDLSYARINRVGIAYSFRIGATYRYFFTDHFGLNLGVGLAHGGLMNAGLSFRL